MTHRRWIVLLPFLATAACGGVPSHGDVSPTARRSHDNLAGALEELLDENVAIDGPGAVLVVMHRGEVLFSSCRGLAQVEANEPMTMSTAFRLASLSKQLTAMAVLILASRSLLALDDPLGRWLPEFARIHPVGDEVTLRQILGHTSGIPDYLDAMDELGVADEPELDNARVMALLLEQKELDFSPGERFEYSNSNYVLAAEIVARASGVSFSRFLEDEVFAPLGMEHAVVRDDPALAIPHRAYGYQIATDGYERLGSVAPVVGDGGIFASPTDFVAWERGLVSGRLVPAPLLEEAFRSGRLNDGSTTGYGLGWFVDEDKLDRGIVRHTGSFVGFRHAIIRSIAEGWTVVVFSNLDSFVPARVVSDALALAREGGDNRARHESSTALQPPSR